MESQHQTQAPAAGPDTQLCSNNCGFFGNTATEGMCSKCWRDADAQRQKVAGEVLGAAVAQQPPTSLALPVVPAMAAAADTPLRPAQANRNRCFGCNKRVGLLGFECRCGFVYCSAHRHAADHACSFDYATMDRARLAAQNPLVAASKLDKL